MHGLAGAYLLAQTVWSQASCSTTVDGRVYSCKSHLDPRDQGEDLEDGGSILSYYDNELVGMEGGEFCLLPWGLTFETRGGLTIFLRTQYVPHNTLRGRCKSGRRFCSALFSPRSLIEWVATHGIAGRGVRAAQ